MNMTVLTYNFDVGIPRQDLNIIALTIEHLDPIRNQGYNLVYHAEFQQANLQWTTR